jgi:hypothetical protein
MMAWVSQHQRLAVVGLLALFLLLATLYNVTSAPFDAPDEIGHFYYVVYLLQNRRLPVVPGDEPPPNYEQEGIQPPLYYASAALFVRALSAPLRLDLEDADAPLDVNPHSVCARPGARYNVSYQAHDPRQERFPYRGRVRVLHTVRLWSSLLGIATITGVFAAVRLAFPDVPPAAWLAACLTALNPEFLFTAGSANNDNLVTALTTWGVYLMLRLLRDGLRWSHTLVLGLVTCLAALSKLSGALLLPLALVAIPLAGALRRPKPPKRSLPVPEWSSVIFLFAAITGWWFLRNWTLYGDLTGTRPMLEMLAVRKEMSMGTLIRELPGLFRSWWGVFGCTAPPAGFYLFYLVLVLGGLAGLVADRHRVCQIWPQVGVLLAWLALMGVAYARWNWVIHAPKGRLLYPAMVSVAGLLGRGWAAWFARRRWFPVALFVLLALGAVAVPFLVIAPPVLPPRLYSTAADVHPEHPLDGRFGAEIALLGYDLNGTSFEAGDWLDLTLYWQALARPAGHYTLAIQLVSAVPGETAKLVNFNTWTGGGNYPTGNWHHGDVIADRYRLRLPADVVRAQAWVLQVVLFDLDTGTRLPFTLDDQPAGKAAAVVLLRVGASNSEGQAAPEGDRLTSPIHFDDAIALDGVRVTEEGEALGVTLWWRNVAPLATDTIVFVHLYDAEGQLIATADAPPLSGGFPTPMWQPGDRVRDERIVPWPEEGNAPFQLGIGWYDPSTSVRLAATTVEGTRLPDDTVLVPIVR